MAGRKASRPSRSSGISNRRATEIGDSEPQAECNDNDKDVGSIGDWERRYPRRGRSP
jgi:hypothetical protein